MNPTSPEAMPEHGGAWKRSRPSWPWRDYLTADEQAVIVDAERKRATAKQMQAEAAAIIAPIQNRAIHRAKYAASSE